MLKTIVDRSGNGWFLGYSESNDFPTKKPLQQRNGGGRDAVLVKLSPSGEMLFSTYFGGSGAEYFSGLVQLPDGSILIGGATSNSIASIALDRENNIWLAGGVYGQGFPIKNPFQSGFAAGTFNGFLLELDPTGRNILYSTYLNNLRVWDIVVDKADNVYFGGLGVSQEFVLKNSLQGGRGNEQGVRLAVAADGSVFAAGVTTSLDYPTKNAYQPVPGGDFDGILFRLTESIMPRIPAFTTNPSQLTFRFLQGESVPPAQTVGVNGAVNGLVATAIEPWLRVTPALAVSMNPSGLTPGIYRGMVRLTPPTGVAGTVAVTLNVLAAPPILTAIEPARLSIGSDDTEITLRGSGLSNKTTVQVQTLPWVLSPVLFVDSSTLRFRIPKPYFSGETSYSITVQNPDSAISKPASLAVGRPAPAIAAKGIVSAASFAGDAFWRRRCTSRRNS